MEYKNLKILLFSVRKYVKDLVSWWKPNNVYQRKTPMHRVQGYRSA